MDGFDPSALQAVAGWLLLVALFVGRELAAGALKKAGEHLWEALTRWGTRTLRHRRRSRPRCD